MQSQKGFSLLEAMVAGFILFIVLVAVSDLFTTATKSSIRATSAAQLHYQVPIILEQVRYQLHDENKRSGRGTWQGVGYRWQAKQLKSDSVRGSEAIGQAAAADSGVNVSLWEVTLTVSLDGGEREFRYKEVSW